MSKRIVRAAAAIVLLSTLCLHAQAQAVSQLSGAIAYDWVVRLGALADGSDELELTLTARGDWYVGFGVSPSDMDGALVTCYLPPSASAAVCSDWNGGGHSIGTRASRSTLVRTTKSGASYTVVLRMPAESMGIKKGADQRVVFAHGTYDATSNRPQRHAYGARGDDVVNFHTQVQARTPVPPTAAPPTRAPLTPAPQTRVPATAVPATAVPATAVPATAVPATPSPPSTLVPSTPEPSTAQPSPSSGAVSQLAGAIEYDWVVRLGAASDGTDELELTLTAYGDWYVGFGVSRYDMDGPIVTCYLASEASEAACSDWDGIEYGIGARTSRSTVVSTSRTGSSYSVVLRMSTESMGIVQGTEQRVIFAHGSYDASENQPQQHSYDARGVDRHDFYTRTAATDEPPQNSSPETSAPSTEAPARPNTTKAPSTGFPQENTTAPASLPGDGPTVVPDPPRSGPEARLNGAIAYDWVVHLGAASDGSDELELTLTANGDWYVGFGVSPFDMNGPIVTCYLPPSTSEAVCSDWDGSGTDIGTRASRSTVVSTTKSGSSYTVIVRMTADSMGIVQGASQRVIFARGSFNTGIHAPFQHPPGGYGSDVVDFYLRTAAPEPIVSLDNFTTVLPVTTEDFTTAPHATTPSEGTLPTGEQPYMQIAGYSRVATSDTVAVLGGSCTLKWRAYGLDDEAATDAGGDSGRRFAAREGEAEPLPGRVVQIDLSGPVGRFVGLGVAESQMDGPLVTVAVADATSGAGLVSDWTGVGVSSVQPRAATSTIVQSSSSGGTFSITVQCAADALSIVPGRQRAIVATGRYDTQFNAPLSHGGGKADRDEIVVDFLAGTAGTQESNRHFLNAVGVVCGVCALYLLVASALNFAKIALSPRASIAANAFTAVLFIGLVAFYAAMRYLDYKANLKAYPVERSFGDATVFCFWFVLYPVPKHLGLLRLTGASWERLVPYHLMVGVLVLVASTCHLIAMGLTMKQWKVELVSTQGQHPALFGFLAWLCLLVLVTCALTLRRIAYWLFKLTHVLFIPTLVFACLHYHPLIYALIPPLANWLADVLWRAKGHCQASAVVPRARFHAKGGFTELRVTLSGSAARPGPGQFVLIGTNAGGAFKGDLYPFSVAWFDAKSNEALLCVKANAEGSWTRRLANYIASNRASAPLNLVWVGPFGSLQVPLGKTPTCVLVAGGIGITALLSILQAVRERRDGGENVSRVVLLWSVREAALVDALQPLLTECAAASTRDGSPYVLLLELYLTTREPDDDTTAGATFHNVERRRINVPADVPRATWLAAGSPQHQASPQQGQSSPQQRQASPQQLPGIRVEFSDAIDDVDAVISKPAVTIYCCGPEALMTDVASYARSTPNILLHTETFTL
jgi:NAD(P)H-flavin reductase